MCNVGEWGDSTGAGGGGGTDTRHGAMYLWLHLLVVCVHALAC